MIKLGNSDAEDLFPSNESPQAEATTPKRELKPWHKPRKQWVRENQWADLCNQLMQELQFDGRPFRYLTLPGEDLLDIRVLHDVCQEKNVLLKYLGFDVTRKADVNVSFDEVFRLPNIHESSEIIPDRIEVLAVKDSIGLERATNFGGFDAINLDVCGSIGNQEAGNAGSYLDTIKEIFNIQTQKRTDSWLLFITSLCNRTSIKGSVRSLFADLVFKNASHHPQFENAIKSSPFNLELEMIEQEISGEPLLDEAGHLHTIAIGFSKWLLQLSPQEWKITQELTAGYRVASISTQPDMLSLAFRFDRRNAEIIDPSGGAPNKQAHEEPNNPSELDMAMHALDKIERLVDVDQLIHDDSQLQDSLIASNVSLLEQARYDPRKVREWSRANLWTPPETV